MIVNFNNKNIEDQLKISSIMFFISKRELESSSNK